MPTDIATRLTQDVLHARADLPAAARWSVRGDDTGASSTLVYLDDSRVARFSSWSRLVRTLEGAGLLRIDPAGVQFALAYGLVPPPYSLYANVYVLGMGDRLNADLGSGEVRFDVEFPYCARRSRGDETLDLDRLERILVSAVERHVPADGPALFMQSAGKDSTGLLLGLAAASRPGLRAATYDPLYREREASPARELARRFGIEHVTVEANPHEEYATLVEFLAAAPAICADVALIAYLHTLQRCEVEDGVVIDGLGNDAYMGYVPSRRDRWLGALASAGRFPALWGCFEAPHFGDRLAYALKTLLMYPAERSLAGSRPAPKVVRRLVPQSTAFDRFFAELDARVRPLCPVDRRAYVRGRIFDGVSTMLKGRLAAAHRGARTVYPYCDAELIDYCFHLPRDERYDERRGVNKLPLRRLLEREIGASPFLGRKGSFRYDVRRFVAANEAAIRAEIRGAAHLLREAESTADFLLHRKSNYVHAYMLTTLFIVAGWLARRPARVVEPLKDGAARVPSKKVNVVV